MKTSVQWLNRYLLPADVTADEAEAVLMSVGFPTESRETVGQPGQPDTRLDVEITSNRGDCLSHVGLAREVAAKTRRTLTLPALTPPAGNAGLSAGPVASAFKLENRAPHACPLFTARVIKGVKVGPSPAWLRTALENAGQRSINNIVDATNFVSLELGNPCHAFDLSKLAGATLIVRPAADKETLTTLDGRARTLLPDHIVVADAERAQSLAGVMGGQSSEVSPSTTDVVLEVATWDPATIRKASRHHQLRTDASHRYERIVDSRTLEAASNRLAAIVLEVAGGRLCDGLLTAGGPPPSATPIRFRPTRCRAILGIDVAQEEMIAILRAVECAVEPIGRAGEELACTPPPFRPDLTREVDLIEEVARIKGLDALPLQEKLGVQVRPPQPREVALREIAATLVGQGFFETLTFSFTSPALAEHFTPQGLERIDVDDERRGGEPTLRPSVLSGLLHCRRNNQNAQVQQEGGLRFFEFAHVFAQTPKAPSAQGDQGPRTREAAHLALLLDIPAKGKVGTSEIQSGVRALRGVIESLIHALAGQSKTLAFTPAAPHCKAFDQGAFARITLAGADLGYIGLFAKPTLAAFDVEHPCVGAELKLDTLLSAYTSARTLTPLPAFPGIERDLSIVVPETTPWDSIAAVAQTHMRAPLEACSFVGTYRGQQVGAGKKSVTLRLGFRDAARTLRSEEADAPVAALVADLSAKLGAVLRA